MKLLSIDPGLSYTGYALFSKEGSKVILLSADVIKLNKALSIPQKLRILYDTINEKICDNEVTDLAIETPFLGKNAATFAKLGYIRGILYLLSEMHLLTLHEFAPQVVKRAVAGHGMADKYMIMRVVKKTYPQLIEIPRHDISDAVAVGMCAISLMK